MLKKTLFLCLFVVGLLISSPLFAKTCSYSTSPYYSCEDSVTNASIATAYPWLDISGTGTSVPGIGDDTVTSVAMPFSFNLSGISYNSVRVSSNGVLEFGSTSNNSYTPTTIASASSMPTSILPYWRDLVPSSGQVRYQAFGTTPNRSFVVQYTNAINYNVSSQKNTFQAQLFENGKFVFRYQTMSGNGNTGTTGYYNSSTDYSEYSYSAANLTSGLALLWTPPAKLVAQYRLEELSWTGAAGEVQDSSGNSLNATTSGSPLPSPGSSSPARTGASGTCGYASFSGPASGGGKITITGLPVDSTTTAKTSVSFWMYWDGTDLAMPMGWNQYNLWFYNGYFGFNTSNSDIYGISATGLANGWHHVVAIFNNGDVTKNQLYIDGVSKTLTQLVGTPLSSLAVTQSTLNISGWGNDSNYRFSGKIDEVKVYNNVLTAAQVTALYTETHACPVPSAPLVEYRMDESYWNGTNNEILDSSNNSYHGTAKGGASTASAKICRGGSFNGTSNYAEVADRAALRLTGNYTISAWVKTGAAGTGALVSKFSPTSPYPGYGVQISGNLGYWNGNGSWYSGGTSVNNNTWRHVVVQVTGTSLQYYVDGVASGTAITIGAAGTQTTSPLEIGLNNDTVNSSKYFNGQIDELKFWNTALSAAQIATLYNYENAGKNWDGTTRSCPIIAAPDHIQLEHSGSGVTCAAGGITVKACGDPGCTVLFSGSTAVTLSASAGTWSTNPVSFTGSTSVNLAVTTAGTVTIGTSASTPGASNITRCFAGSTETCNLVYADTGFKFDIPNHVAGNTQSVSIQAVVKSSGSSACTSAFANMTRSITFICAYTNPGSGTLPVKVNNTALNAGNNAALACDGSGKTVSASFDASGIATASVLYSDVGQMQVNATYTGSSATGDAGLVMTGSDYFIAAPSAFAFSAITAGPIRAGNAFSATVSAINASGSVTPNFGRESTPEAAFLSYQLVQPLGTTYDTGILSGGIGSFSNGSSTASNLIWSEVGNIKLTSALSSGNYLNSGFTASGSSSTVGEFVPHHFTTAAQQGCTSDNFTYSGQPYRLTVTAKSALNNTTKNYDGTAGTTPNFAKLVTLSEGTTSLGIFSPNTIAASSFINGVALLSPVSTPSFSPIFSYSNSLTVPSHVYVRATDANASSAGYAEGFLNLYSGRLSLQNANGSEQMDLPVPLQAEYWSGSYYQLNSIDNCSSLAVPVAGSGLNFGNPLTSGQTTAKINGVSSGSSLLMAGNGNLLLSKPGAGNTGYVDISVSAPGYLKFNWQGSGLTDPSARATFGVYKGDPAVIHFQELY